MRLSHSHIRFGTFQRHAYLESAERVGALVDHAHRALLPGAGRAPTIGPPPCWARSVDRAARLTARWMAAGFVHGVLNTDNMNITGESFDYGP